MLSLLYYEDSNNGKKIESRKFFKEIQTQEVRNSGFTKSSYETELHNMTSHFELRLENLEVEK